MNNIPPPLPSGAVGHYEWQVNDNRVTRIFFGPEHGSAEAKVCVVGEQDYSGTVLHRTGLIDVPGGIAEITAGALRQLAADCVSIADELDGSPPMITVAS